MPEPATPVSLHWAAALAAELRRMDQVEASFGGLYGIWHAPPETPLAKRSLLAGRRARIIRQIDGMALYWWNSSDESLAFAYPGQGEVFVKFWTYADRKVHRLAGAPFDRRRGSPPEPPPDLLVEIPKLGQEGPPYVARSVGILFLGHMPTAKDVDRWLGDSTSEWFLKRYRLSHLQQTWEDIHGRGFQTTLCIWYREIPAN